MCDAINLMGDLSASRKGCNTMINRMNGKGDCSTGLKSVLAAGLILCCLLAQGPLAGVRAQSPPPPSGGLDAEPAQKRADEVSVARFSSKEDQATVPLVSGWKLLFTDAVRVNGNRLGYFLIDTGINLTVLDTDVAKKLGVKPFKDLMINGEVAGHTYVVELLSLGPLEIAQHLVGETDLKFLQQFAEPVVGILGNDVLARVPFTIDYAEPALVLHNPQRFSPPALLPAFDLRLVDQFQGFGPFSNNIAAAKPAVEAELNGRGLTFLLDTGLNRSLFVSRRDAASQPEMVGRAVHPLRVCTSLVSQEEEQYQFKVDRLKLFGKTEDNLRDALTAVTTPEVSAPGKTGKSSAIGSLLLQNFRLTFDFHRQKVWAEPAPGVDQLLQEGHLDLAARNFANFPMLAEAALYGESGRFLSLLKAGAPVGIVDDVGRTLLHMAVLGGSHEILTTLLEHKNRPDVNKAALDGVTPLMLAASLCEPGLVRELIESGADVNSQTIKGDTALRYAVDSDYIDVARMLLEAGAQPDLALFSGHPPLALAAAKGNYEMVRLLVKHGAALVFAAKKGETLVHCAALGGSMEILELALNGLPEGAANQATKDGTTPLMIAAEQGYLQMVEELVKAGADVRAGSSVNQSVGEQMAIHFAAMKGRDDVVRFLLEQGVSVDQGTSKGLTPLMLAAGSGHASTVNLLLNNGAGANRTETYEMTALHYAAKLGRPGVIPALLNAGARVASPAQKGVRPLDFAALRGDVDVARLLVEAGADPAAKGTHGNSAIDFARKQGHSSLVEFLEKKAASVPPAASGASPSPMAVEPPKEGGLSLNIRTPGGFKLIARGNILFCTDKDGKAVWQTAIPEGTTGFTIQNDKVTLKPHGPVIDLQSATLVPGPAPLAK